MKKTILVILFCLFLLPITINAESLNYTNQQNHYSFTLPSNWVKIPKLTIDKVFQQIVDETGVQFVDYTTGFQLVNVPDFQYPYILVQEHKINTPSYAEITKTIESNKFSKDLDKTLDQYTEFMSNASIKEPFVDKERDIIFMNIEMDVTAIGKVKGLVAIFLGQENIVQLIFYSTKLEYTENLSTFNQIIDSFKYEPGYEYNIIEAKKNDPKKLTNGLVETGISALGSVLFIGLLFGN